MGDKIILSEKRGVATITLNRPEKGNCIDLEMIKELEDAVLRLERGLSRALIITGAGKAFSTGADINAINSIKEDADLVTYIEKVHSVFMRLEKIEMPVIAAINGPCYGGGLELALACDLRISSLKATFALPEVSIGLIPGGGGTYRLPNIVGDAVAKEIIYLGRHGGITSMKALFIGLINRIAWNPLKAAESMADDMSMNSYNAIVHAKKTIARREDYGEAHKAEILAFAECSRHSDSSEGINAFIGKRQPDFEKKINRR